MKRYNIVKKVPILLLAGMLTVSMAPWTAYAEEPENTVSLGDGQEGDVPQIQSEPGNTEGADESVKDGGTDVDPQDEADDEGTDGELQGETGNGGTDVELQDGIDNPGTEVITQGGTDNGGTDADPQDETDDNGMDGNLQNGDGLTEDGSLPEGFPGDLSGLTGGSTALSQVDPTTGIAADADENVFPLGTVLYVTPIESGESYDQLGTLMSMIADQFKVYDIRFINMMDYSMTEPAGTVRISIPVPDGFDTAHLSVSKIGEDGTRTEMTFEIVEGKTVFETDSAGTFLIAQMKALPESLAMTEKTARVELTKRSAQLSSGASGVSSTARLASPKTGDDNDIAVWGGLMGAAVVLILVFVVIKRKK